MENLKKLASLLKNTDKKKLEKYAFTDHIAETVGMIVCFLMLFFNPIITLVGAVGLLILFGGFVLSLESLQKDSSTAQASAESKEELGDTTKNASADSDVNESTKKETEPA